MEISEALEIAKKLGVKWDDFVLEYTDSRWPGVNSFLLRHVNGSCIFLKIDPDNRQSLCSIHNFKPVCCLEWQSDLRRSECQKGLFDKWGLQIDSSGNILGNKENLDLFKNYFQSLK